MSKCEHKSFFSHILVLLLLLLSVVQCYPTSKLNILSKVDQKDEKRFPNGTVVGDYNYLDKDGNPVHVKYYADDAGYGVELRRVKQIETNKEQAVVYSDKQEKLDNLWQTCDSSSDILPDYQNTVSSPTSKYLQISDKILKDTGNKSYYKTSYKTSPDYEIYLQNELQAPKYGSDKVRIYIDKGKRKIREILNDVATFKYFDQP